MNKEEITFIDQEIKKIGDIENYYGGLFIKSDNDRYYWGIENYTSTRCEEIPKYLYDALIKFENERDKEI